MFEVKVFPWHLIKSVRLTGTKCDNCAYIGVRGGYIYVGQDKWMSSLFAETRD